jgi:hypothetical protein
MAKSSRGRPKGARNKITNLAKQAIQMAFDKLGGVDALVAWVKEDKANRYAFYTRVYPMLLPRPAVDVEPVEEKPLQAVKGAFTWRTPDWAKKVEKAQLRSQTAQRAAKVRTDDDPAKATDEAEWPP